MDRRLGFVGIVIEDRRASASRINELLSECGDLIVARVGIPHLRGDCSVITLVVDATTDELGRLTGLLGAVPGVSVKSSLSKPRTHSRAGEPNGAAGQRLGEARPTGSASVGRRSPNASPLPVGAPDREEARNARRQAPEAAGETAP